MATNPLPFTPADGRLKAPWLMALLFLLILMYIMVPMLTFGQTIQPRAYYTFELTGNDSIGNLRPLNVNTNLLAGNILSSNGVAGKYLHV